MVNESEERVVKGRAGVRGLAWRGPWRWLSVWGCLSPKRGLSSQGPPHCPGPRSPRRAPKCPRRPQGRKPQPPHWWGPSARNSGLPGAPGMEACAPGDALCPFLTPPARTWGWKPTQFRAGDPRVGRREGRRPHGSPAPGYSGRGRQQEAVGSQGKEAGWSGNGSARGLGGWAQP